MKYDDAETKEFELKIFRIWMPFYLAAIFAVAAYWMGEVSSEVMFMFICVWAVTLTIGRELELLIKTVIKVGAFLIAGQREGGAKWDK